MSMSIGSSTSSQYYQVGGNSRPPKPDPAQMAEQLFSQLDTKGQGYIEKSDLESAFSQLGSDSSGASVDDVFSSLDGDGDGKITKDEMSSNLQKLAEELDSQFNAMRVQNGMPPPPPPGAEGKDQGFTADQLSEIAGSTSDTGLATLMESLASNFDAADANGDGKITHDEAMAYQEESGSNTSSGTQATGGSENAVMKRIMDLMQAYGGGSADSNSDSVSSLLGSLSVSA